MGIVAHSRKIRRSRKDSKAYTEMQGKPRPKRWANMRTKTHAKNTIVFSDKKVSENKWWIGLPYQEYLKTKHWRKVKYMFFTTVKPEACNDCGKKFVNRKEFNVHHKTYDSIGHELMEDLELLCRGCHELKHGG